MRTQDKQDDIYVIEVINYMSKELGIQLELLKRDWYILFSKGEHQYINHTEYVTMQQSQTYKIQHPDIIYQNYNGTIKCIIEIDGSIHDTKSGKHKTHKRDRVYDESGIPYIVVNGADLKLIDMTWQRYIEKEIKEIEKA